MVTRRYNKDRGVLRRFHADPVEVGVTAAQYEDEKITRAKLQRMDSDERYVFRQRLQPELGSLASGWLLETRTKPGFYHSTGIVIASEVDQGMMTDDKHVLHFDEDGLVYAELMNRRGQAIARIDIGYLLSAATEEDIRPSDLIERKPVLIG